MVMSRFRTPGTSYWHCKRSWFSSSLQSTVHLRLLLVATRTSEAALNAKEMRQLHVPMITALGKAPTPITGFLSVVTAIAALHHLDVLQQ